MERGFTEVTLTLHGGEEPIVISDSVEDGKFIGIGTQAARQIAQEKAVRYTTSDGEFFIPFHAIIGVTIERTAGEVPTPEDAFCTSGGGDEECSPSSSIVGCAEVDEGKAA